jgi:D-beta-D-heptose 7-phosphate kinase/D-beta-D-heptose 1-phosphate adenosyltransferase
MKVSVERFDSIFSETKPVLVVGDMMVDEFIWGAVERVSPEAPVPVVDIVRETFHPGGAGNVVVNIKTLGGEVYPAGVIGQDREGETFLSDLRKNGIETDGLICDSHRPTTLKTRIIAHSQQMIRVDREKKGMIGEDILKSLISYIQQTISKVSTVVISDYGKGVIGEELLEELIPICKKHDVVSIVDPKIGNFGHYKGVSVITPNHYEAQDLTGIMIEDEKSLLSCMNAIMHRINCETVIVTRGEKGMSMLMNDSSIFHIPTKAREVYDVTGAGDTVVAALALALSSGGCMKEAVILANYAAGLVVEKVGTATVTREELRQRIEEDCKTQ